MPVVGGLESTGMIRALEEQEGYSKTPIIALTGESFVREAPEVNPDD